MNIRFKYIGFNKIKVPALKKIDGTIPKSGENLIIQKGDVFQIKEIDALYLVNTYKQQFLPVAQEDLKKAVIIAKIEQFKRKLELKQKLISNNASLNKINILSDSLRQSFASLEKHINDFGDRNQTLMIFGEKVEVDLYIVSIRHKEKTELSTQALKKCLIDINMIVGIIESLSLGEIDETFASVQYPTKTSSSIPTPTGRKINKIQRSPHQEPKSMPIVLTVFGLLLIVGVVIFLG